MSDLIPQSNKGKIGGLGPKAQKLQALREKAAAQGGKGGLKAAPGSKGTAVKAKESFAGKKVSFQRKAV